MSKGKFDIKSLHISNQPVVVPGKGIICWDGLPKDIRLDNNIDRITGIMAIAIATGQGVLPKTTGVIKFMFKGCDYTEIPEMSVKTRNINWEYDMVKTDTKLNKNSYVQVHYKDFGLVSGVYKLKLYFNYEKKR